MTHARNGAASAAPARAVRAVDRYTDPRISLTIPRDLLNQLTDEAEHSTDGDRSELIRTACRAWLLLLTREDKIPLTDAEWEWVTTGENTIAPE